MFIVVMQVTMMLFLRQEWVDENLVWDSELYGGKFIRLSPTDIWIPDTFLINAVDRFEQIQEVTALPLRYEKLFGLKNDIIGV